MATNGVINIPSSQILYIGLGVLYGSNQETLLSIAIIGALGNTCGNVFLTEIVKKSHKHEYIAKYIGHYSKLAEPYIARIHVFHLFLMKLTPSIKVLVPYISGIQARKLGQQISIYLSSSFIWSLIFLFVGAFFGKNTHGISLYFVLVTLFVVIILFPRMYKIYRRKHT